MDVRTIGRANDLQALQRQFTKWRKGKKSGRGRIPQALWRKAIGAAQQFGVAATARDLGLEVEKLKKLAEISAPIKPKPAGLPITAARFKVPHRDPTTPFMAEKNGLATCAVEFGTADGPHYVRVLVQWHGVTPNLSQLIQAIQS